DPGGPGRRRRRAAGCPLRRRPVRAVLVRGAAPAARTVAALTAARPRASAPHPRRSARARLPCGGRVARDRTGDLSNPRLARTFLELRGAEVGSMRRRQAPRFVLFGGR